jgi:hypothetical protein
VTWDDQLTRTNGSGFTGTGHVAMVEDGKIVTWNFGTLRGS